MAQSQYFVPGLGWFDDSHTAELLIAGTGSRWIDGIGTVGINGSSTVDPFTQTATLRTVGGINGSSTVAPFTQTATLKTLGGINGSNTVDPFTQTTTLKTLGGINGSSTVDPFTQTTTLVVLDKINGSSTVAPFTQTTTLKTLGGINGSSTVDPFTQTATVKVLVTIDGSSTVDPFTQTTALTVTSSTVSIDGSSTVDPFTQTTTLVVLDKIIGSSTLSPFTQTATLAVYRTINGNSTMAAFTQDAELYIKGLKVPKLNAYAVLTQNRMHLSTLIGYAVLGPPTRHITFDQIMDPFVYDEAIFKNIKTIRYNPPPFDFRQHVRLRVLDELRRHHPRQIPFDTVPFMSTNQPQWYNQIARAINNVLKAGQNTTISYFTLNQRSTSTILTDSRIGANSFINLIPLNEPAQVENWWIPVQTRGSALILHQSSPAIRTFRLLIVG